MNNLVNKKLSSGTLVFQCFYLKSQLLIANLTVSNKGSALPLPVL